MATTDRGIYYPVVGDIMTPLANRFASLAQSVDDALGAITPGSQYAGTDAERLALVEPELRKGITWRTTDTNLTYMYDGSNWIYWQRNAVPFAQAAGRSNVSASGSVTINFPAGRFTIPPVITTQVVAVGSIDIPRVFDDVTTTGFSINVYNIQGSRVARNVWWHAIQMTPTGAAG